MGLRPHNKSRLGCQQCKRRKIKCDLRPRVCANCEKRGLDCGFQSLIPSTSLSASNAWLSSPMVPSSLASTPPRLLGLDSSKESPGKCSSSAKQISRPTSRLSRSATKPASIHVMVAALELCPERHHLPHCGPSTTSLWELEGKSLAPQRQNILVHFELCTSQSLATDAPAKAAWQRFVPTLVSKNPYLGHALLSVTALHLAHLEQDRNVEQTMMLLATSQMDKALARYAHELRNLSKHNASAVFACSSFVCIFLIRIAVSDMKESRDALAARVTKPSPASANEMIKAVLKIYHALYGTNLVLHSNSAPIVGQGEMESIVTRPWWPKRRFPATWQALKEDKKLAELEKLWKYPGRQCNPHFECFRRALLHLRQVFALVSQLTMPHSDLDVGQSIPNSVDHTPAGLLRDRGAIFEWIIGLPKAFVDLIQQQNREALVLLAHFAILMVRVQSVWWLEGIGTNMVVAVAMSLPQKDLHLIDWPIVETAMDVPSLFH
ncbi:hypothetical protein FB567DRAFT_435486 [Paraphoma chrysanthemicola]|uniref:Zn(2)-C6 fungal-type domain-containing protein n=1 Tax=Paraphoma chrysanthemicola TaxID=798071 RepID=A0A8K0W219_9PLEO|nr:hypothetical protein FB567DRAFT_435486 [Paraphoma chrysanthemicola]